MNIFAPVQARTAPIASSRRLNATGLLQRPCVSGAPPASLSGRCTENFGQRSLQAKLNVGPPHDPLEQEADRVAERVTARSAHSAAGESLPGIHRHVADSSRKMEAAPASVEGALATPGRQLAPGLRQDMEQHFGHDFSRVRVHAGPAAEHSAADIDAQAYTVGHDIVFGAGRFAPETPAGRHLLAHELTHVLQQGGQQVVQRAPKAPELTIGEIDTKSNDPNCRYQKGEVEKANAEKGFLENDVDRAEFFGVEPADAVVIADFKVDDGNLRPSTEAILRKFWLPTFDKDEMKSWEIVGFNDCVGWESRNQQLRAQRAQAVAKLLPGVPASAAPADTFQVPNASERSRAINRSVIIRPKAKLPAPPKPPRKPEVTITPEEPKTKDCSPDQRRQLAIAFPMAKLMAQKGLSAVTSPDKGPVIQFLLQRYFGEDALSHLPEIRDGFAKILNNWQDWESRFDCEAQTEGSCPSDDPHARTLAYVKVKKHLFSANEAIGTVRVCAASFDDPEDMQELASTLLHELSHRLDNTSDRQYCTKSRDWCSKLSTKAAIDNADSYSEFARWILNASL
jgi:outer membrane protein OmpA-like peptidoglycan-associated protein